MSNDRYVVLGLARARADWFRRLAQWANSSSVPVELVKCLSHEELHARLASGRMFSALLTEADQQFLDRDFFASAARAGCPVVVVEGRRLNRDWTSLGAATVLPADFDQTTLMSKLHIHTRTVQSGLHLPGGLREAAPPPSTGVLIALCGPGGTGVSTCAMGLAQSLAPVPARPDRPRSRSAARLGNHRDVQGDQQVLLADLRRRAEHAMLHDAGDVVPGLRELVEAHRYDRPTCADAIGLTFFVAERGYHLLLGVHRPSAWSAIKPRALEAALGTLLEAFGTLICDIDADFEGEHEAGSIDVEDRNAMSRATAARARVVLAVGLPGMKGVYSLARVISELIEFGVDPDVVVPVVNRAPRQARARSEIAAALASLTHPRQPAASPVFLPDKQLEATLRAGTRIPVSIASPLRRAALAVLGRAPCPATKGPEPVSPGSLGGRGLDDSMDPGIGEAASL